MPESGHLALKIIRSEPHIRDAYSGLDCMKMPTISKYGSRHLEKSLIFPQTASSLVRWMGWLSAIV